MKLQVLFAAPVFAFQILIASQQIQAFTPTNNPSWGIARSIGRLSCPCLLYGSNPLKPVPPEQEGVPIPFVDARGSNFIECYADSIAEVDGVEYTIGVPCDYAVALCYFREDQQLVPIELTDALMDDIYPIAESIVEEEFGEELVLQRTPQTLTLVGELEDDDDEDDEDFDLDDEDEDDGDEEVEVLLSFEQDGRQYNLVRMLDPMLLVGKADKEQTQNRLLLTPEESDKVMPVLEDMFLKYREDREDVGP